MTVVRQVARLFRGFPVIGRYIQRYEELRDANIALSGRLAGYERGPFPPGHFHSPLPDFSALERDGSWDPTHQAPAPLDVDLNVAGQLALLDEFSELAGRYDPPDHREPSFRYWYVNDFFSYLDASTLACMLLRFKPRRVVEIGSGFSSAVMMDLNERCLGGSLELTMIEPYPDRVRELLRADDFRRARLVEAPIGDVDPAVWEEMQADDVLFVDSSHVSKANSDVNLILFSILPKLPVGILIHFHDIFYPFEYPREWALGGIAWNESYLLHAFLQDNSRYRVVLFNDFLKQQHGEALHRALPASIKDPAPDRSLVNAPGNSLWLRKVG